ncbi:MAG TPA: hypothetical protein VF765_31395 [Polyangiaceae bacterium]
MNVFGGFAAPLTPNIESYLAALPRGLASYPECVHKGEPLGVWLQRSPLRDVARLVPTAVAPLLDRHRPLPTWVPDVHANVIYMAIRQACFADDAGFLAHARECNRAVLETPTNRLLFWAATPRAILRAASLRWGSLHRGSNIDVRFARDNSAEVVLTFPRFLYPEIVLRGNATGFQAAVENTGARDVEAHLRSMEPTRATFVGRWR